jgi:tetratricopeptide (TPR) repeat protein
MPKLTFSLLRNSTLSMLMLLSAVALVLHENARPQRDIINKIDQKIRIEFTNYYVDRFENARELLESSPEKGLDALLDMEKSLKAVLLSDRLSPLKQDVLKELRNIYDARGDHDTALSYYRKLTEHSEKNLLYWQSYGNKLQSLGYNNKALAVLRDLFRKTPLMEQFSAPYINLLHQQGRHDEAFSALAYHLDMRQKIDSAGWFFLWGFDTGFTSDNIFPVYPEFSRKHMQLSFDVPATARRIRVSVPNHALFTLTNTRVEVIHSGQVIFESTDPQVFAIAKQGGLMIIKGEAQQYMYWELPEHVDIEEGTTGRFSANYSEVTPWLQTQLQHETLPDFLERLRTLGDTETLDIYQHSFERYLSSPENPG